MPSDKIIYICGALGLVNLALVLVVLILPEWRVNAPVASQPNMNFFRLKEGLWLRCSGYQNQFFSCDMYDSSIIGLDAYLNAFRAFMIIALLASIGGVVCSALGMRCTTILEEEGKGKRWVVISGGICHIVAGVLTGISVSWYAAEVVREYYSPYYQNQKMKYTLGACLYVGWVSMVFSLICGCLMVCCTCFNKPVDESYKYEYKAPPSHDKYSMPPVQSAVYHSDPYYKEKSYHHNREPDYHRSSHHSSRSHRHHRRSRDDRRYYSKGRSSSSDSRDSTFKSSRHESDIVRASGFV